MCQASKITWKSNKVPPVHVFGVPANINEIKNVAKKWKIPVVEDAAEALGQKLNKKLCGSYGDISTFSFYANKQITTGEGGMITTNNKKLYEKSSSLRNLSFGKKDRFNHDDIAWNYRMTNIQASLGVSQLKRINQIVRKKHKIGFIGPLRYLKGGSSRRPWTCTRVRRMENAPESARCGVQAPHPVH